jgi:single-stranded-DNA-specific exonuclease
MERPRRWNTAEADARAEELAGRLRISPLIAQILLNRGLAEPEQCRDFLQPSLKCLHDPAGIPNLPRAAERIAQAIRDRQKIVIYGDYDVDGIAATSILWHAIRLLGGEVDFYIPHRLEEGYGLNAEAIGQICDEGAGLIVSVDCGVTAVEPAEVARERGVDLIVTDHHEWKTGRGNAEGGMLNAESDSASSIPHSALSVEHFPMLPDCYAIVHPRLPGEGPAYANPYLCGAGVAFKLAWGVGTAMSGASRVSDGFRQFLLEATSLAALATVADVVPLVGENRIIAAFGLGSLKQSRLTGIRALIASAGLSGQKLDSYHAGFLLAPRLNACGRMGHARLAVEMLTRADEATANEIATYLEGQNRARQTMERKILEQALEQIRENGFDSDDCRAIVLGAEDWHPGVIGIVASRIVDRFHRPTVMIGMTNGHGQGSARSIAGFHLARALAACGNCLEAHGGHEMAAGLKLETSRFGDFREAFCAHAQRVLEPAMLVPELRLDAVAQLQQINLGLVQDLARLGPFGHGNRKPLLCCRQVQLAQPPRRVGKSGDHLQLLIRQGGAVMKCIAFNHGHLFERLPAGAQIDLAVEPVLNEYNGRVSVELQVKDVSFP